MPPLSRLLILVGLTALAPAWAGEGAAGGLYQSLTGRSLTDVPGLAAVGVAVGGWLSTGITYNSHNPDDRSNGPVTFNDRSGELQLNQLYVYLERAVNKEAKRWDVGGRIDLLWGSDSRFTQAAGHWDTRLVGADDLRFYHLAIPQAYLELATPLLRGATVKLGHFYTLLGQESVQAPANFFYSHGYLMQYGEPFTHSGALAIYPVNDNLTLSAGAVTGPYGGADNVDKHLENWNFLGGLSWISDSAATSVSAAATTGAANPRDGRQRFIASLVLNQALTEGLHYVLQYDHGYQERSAGRETAHWYGVQQSLTVDLAGNLALGLRGEWFRDDAGIRLAPVAASYYGLTLGLNWKPESWLMLRLEGRNDWADGRGRVIATGRDDHQFTLGANATLVF